MEIKVIGAGCAECAKLYENTQAAVARLGLKVQVTKVEDLLEIVSLGILSAPSLMVDGRLVLSGQVAGVDRIVKLLEKA